MGTSFVYGTPSWGAKLICGVYFLVAVLLLSPIVFQYVQGSSLNLLYYVLGSVGVVFLLAALKPSNWQGWVGFKADEKGLYFPETEKGIKASFFFVPWNNVGLIQAENLYAQKKGITIELSLTQEQIDTHFYKKVTTNQLLGLEMFRDGRFVLAFSQTGFQDRFEAIEVLNRLRASC